MSRVGKLFLAHVS